MSKIKYFVHKYPNKDTFSTQTHPIKIKYFSTTLGCTKRSKVIHTCVCGREISNPKYLFIRSKQKVMHTQGWYNL